MKTTEILKRGTALVIASAFFGCGTTTRYITPWLRTTQHTQFELIAESGSRPGNWMRAERKVAGNWREVRAQSGLGFSLADDTRAVLDGDLMTEDGRTIPLDCYHGDSMYLRATPDGKHLICVMPPDPSARASDQTKGPDSLIEITSRDLNGLVEWRRSVRPPVSAPADAPVQSMDVYTTFLGFIPVGLLFSVEVADNVYPVPTGARSACDAYVLGRDDAWHKIGSLSYRNAERWKCDFAWPWTGVLGFKVTLGKYARGTDGQPDPR